MLVIISDLHLTDGSSGETIKAGAFRIFRERLSDLAYDASWRDEETYRPIKRLDLVLLGDILDPIRSTQWVTAKDGRPETVRPWDNLDDPAFIQKINDITRDILDNNAEALGVLRGMTTNDPITIPPATRRYRPRQVSRNPRSTARTPVEIRIHYMVGNHDWFYYLPGTAYNQIRGQIIDAMGLANQPTEPFPHDPAKTGWLMDLFAPYQVFARHGDIYDPFNYEARRDAPSLGDAVVVELLNRFPQEVAQRMGDELPPDCLAGLREIDNVRPVLMVPIWLDSLLRRTVQDKRKINRVKDIWDELADNFLNLPFVRARDKTFDFFDSVDKLEWALKFSRGVSLETMSQIVTWLRHKIYGAEISFYKRGLEEAAFQNKSARFIVHGHTHHREIVPLDSAMVGGQRLDQMYMNTGTWRRVHELARYQPTQQEFMGYHELTYFAFFKGNERKLRPFEMWGGSLGVN